MAEALKTTYNGIEITYDEYADLWRFELRGRERKAETLVKAKEAIDKPEPREKTFKPIEAWTNRGYETLRFVKSNITSITNGDVDSVWCSIEGRRSKESLSRFYEVSRENDELVQKIADISEQRDELHKKAKELAGQLKKLSLADYK